MGLYTTIYLLTINKENNIYQLCKTLKPIKSLKNFSKIIYYVKIKNIIVDQVFSKIIDKLYSCLYTDLNSLDTQNLYKHYPAYLSTKIWEIKKKFEENEICEQKLIVAETNLSSKSIDNYVRRHYDSSEIHTLKDGTKFVFAHKFQNLIIKL